MFFTKSYQLEPIENLIRLYKLGSISPNSAIWEIKYLDDYNERVPDDTNALNALLQNCYAKLKEEGRQAIRNKDVRRAEETAALAAELFDMPGFLLAWTIYYDLAKDVENKATHYQLKAFLALHQAELSWPNSSDILERLPDVYQLNKITMARHLTQRLNPITDEEVNDYIAEHAPAAHSPTKTS